MRQTIKDVETNVAYRWFLGYSFEDPIPHFSTFSKNYVRRFRETTLFEDIFSHILEQQETQQRRIKQSHESSQASEDRLN